MIDSLTEMVLAVWTEAYCRVSEYWPQPRALRYATNKALRYRVKGRAALGEEKKE